MPIVLNHTGIPLQKSRLPKSTDLGRVDPKTDLVVEKKSNHLKLDSDSVNDEALLKPEDRIAILEKKGDS